MYAPARACRCGFRVEWRDRATQGRIMTLRDLLSGLNARSVTGNLDTRIGGLAYDSRQVGPGYLFFAIRGTRQDGNQFILKAIANGAAAVVSALGNEGAPPSVPWIRVDDERAAMA